MQISPFHSPRFLAPDAAGGDDAPKTVSYDRFKEVNDKLKEATGRVREL